MFNSINHKNKLTFRLLNKGYFSNMNKKIIYSLYMIIKTEFKKKLGRKCKVSLLEQIMITIFKLKYNLPNRILEDLFKIDHVTISRIISKISHYLCKINMTVKDNNYYVVDSTTLRIENERVKR